MSAGQLLAGVGRSLITPPIGLRLNGTLREDVSHAVERELTATALVLSSAGSTIVVIALDMIIISPPEAMALRTRVARRLGIAPHQVYLNVSHSHATPSPPSWNDFDPDTESEQWRLAHAYHEMLVAQTVGATETAHAGRRPARVRAGTGSVRIGVNRREQLPDGTMVLGENPDGVIDPTVGVVRVDEVGGAPIAVLVHHACHPDVLGPKSELISPDFVGATRHTVETITGATMLFLQGAAGDIDPRCGIVLGADGATETQRLGTELGCEAARVYQGLATARVRDRRVAWQSAAAVVTGWRYRDADPAPTPLATVSRVLRLPLREPPPLAQALAFERAAAEELAALDSGAPLPELLRARRRVAWAELQVDAARRGTRDELDVELHGVRIGDVALLGVPGELFVEIGMAIRERSPLPFTLVSGYTNGVWFYIPTAAAFAQGGYEIESHRNYLQPAGPTPEWERHLVEAAGTVLADLARAGR